MSTAPHMPLAGRMDQTLDWRDLEEAGQRSVGAAARGRVDGARGRVVGARARANGACARVVGARARPHEAPARPHASRARADGARARADGARARADGAQARADGARARADEAPARAHGARAGSREMRAATSTCGTKKNTILRAVRRRKRNNQEPWRFSSRASDGRAFSRGARGTASGTSVPPSVSTARRAKRAQREAIGENPRGS